MIIDLQPTLSNENISLRPLLESDFEALFSVASDPLIWEQHPQKNRYQQPIFEAFFKQALASKGAFLVLDNQAHKAIGSTRFYNYDEANNTIFIGYTFLDRTYWGNGTNAIMKALLLEHIFQFVQMVKFHAGAENYRSQKAIMKLGAKKVAEQLTEGGYISFEYDLMPPLAHK